MHNYIVRLTVGVSTLLGYIARECIYAS